MFTKKQLILAMGFFGVELQKRGLCQEMNYEEIVKILQDVDAGRDMVGIMERVKTAPKWA